MNKVILLGRLVRNSEVRYTDDSQPMAVARFTLAVDRKRKRDDEPSADFISCIAFGKSAQFAEKYLSKGSKIAIEGRWQTGSYTNKDGAKVYTNDCVVESMEFAESKRESAQPPIAQDGFMNIPEGLDDELPF